LTVNYGLTGNRKHDLIIIIIILHLQYEKMKNLWLFHSTFSAHADFSCWEQIAIYVAYCHTRAMCAMKTPQETGTQTWGSALVQW